MSSPLESITFWLLAFMLRADISTDNDKKTSLITSYQVLSPIKMSNGFEKKSALWIFDFRKIQDINFEYLSVSRKKINLLS